MRRGISRSFSGLSSNIKSKDTSAGSIRHREVSPTRWCITRQDLDVFEQKVREQYSLGLITDDPANPNDFHDDPEIGPSMYRVTECFIKRETQECGTSWALMRNPEGLPCDVYVTHCWAEGVFEFTKKLRELWPKDAKNLYCCFLSNPQNGDMHELLDQDPLKSPFARALAKARYMLVIPNRRQSLYKRLWCVYEAHLALQRSLIIRMPWRPPRETIAWTLLPGLCIFLFALVFGYLIGTDYFFEGGRHVLAVVFAIFVRCVWERFPKVASYGTCMLLGSLAGAALRVMFDHKNGDDDVPVPLRLPIVDTVIVVWVLICDTMHRMFIVCVLQAVSQEGYHLEFDSVRNAESTEERDKLRIRAAISGHEDHIDEAIHDLKSIGRYDTSVQRNLALGMPPSRLVMGFQPALFVGACYLWAVPIMRPLHLDVRLNPERTRVLWTAFCAALTAIVQFTSLCLGLAYELDNAIFATKAAFWTGLVHHLSVGCISVLVDGPDTLRPEYIQDGGSLNFGIYLSCFLACISLNVLFYTGHWHSLDHDHKLASLRMCSRIGSHLSWRASPPAESSEEDESSTDDADDSDDKG